MAEVADVMRVPTLVANGMQTDVDIGGAFGRTDRQGRYMIKAAELLGLIDRPARGRIIVTPLGKTLMASSGSARDDLIRKIICDSAPGAVAFGMLRAGTTTVAQLEAEFLRIGTTSPAHATLDRRSRELLDWFVDIGLASEPSPDTYVLTGAGSALAAAPPAPVKPPSGTKGKVTPGPRRVVDVERRKAIEDAAVAHVTAHYTNLGYNVESCEKDNKGWDLDVQDPALALPVLVEVKGTSLKAFAVDISPNEYEQMKANADRYRVCVVSDALGTPLLHEFVYDALNVRWVDADTGDVLTIKELTAARVYI